MFFAVHLRERIVKAMQRNDWWKELPNSYHQETAMGMAAMVSATVDVSSLIQKGHGEGLIEMEQVDALIEHLLDRGREIADFIEVCVDFAQNPDKVLEAKGIGVRIS